MEKKFYFIRGNEKHPEKVSAALEKQGAKHTDALDCDYPDHIYYIDQQGEARWTSKNSTLGQMLLEYGEEIFPEPEYKYNVGDAVFYDGEKAKVNGLYNDNGSPAYCLFGHSDPVGEYLIFPCAEPSPEFQPFQKVLVRNRDCDLWRPTLYGFRRTDTDYPHVCISNVWSYCIPFVGNERLLGTADKP